MLRENKTPTSLARGRGGSELVQRTTENIKEGARFQGLSSLTSDLQAMAVWRDELQSKILMGRASG